MRNDIKKLLPRIAAFAAAVVLLLIAAVIRLGQDGYPQGEADGGLVSLPAQSAAETESAPGESPPPEEGAAGSGEEELLFYFFDVGQGDSMLVRVPGDGGYRNILIDTGEYRYADGLTDMLRSLGVERLDLFIITHPHTDHMGCAARMVERFEIGDIAMPRVSDRVTPTTAAYEALLRAVEKKGLTVMRLDQELDMAGAAEPWAFGEDFKIKVMSPRPGADWDSLNNWSAVLRLTYKDVSFMLPGDAEINCLDCVREDAAYNGWDLSSAVLKCSHHGSNDGNPRKWLEAVRPEYAVISCGAGNDYGHPHREPLERLEKLDVKVLRTDQDGTVLCRTDGRDISWETGLPGVN